MTRQITIFDANFFICMNEIRAKKILENLETAGKLLGLEFFISEKVFFEIKGVNASFREKFQSFIHVKQISDANIKLIKDALKRRKIRFPAQDPDLSLIALADMLSEIDNSAKITIVTDDFKLVREINLLYKSKINVLSLSGFLLQIQRTVSNPSLKIYFKNIWRKSLNYTLSYLILRSKVYLAEEKITWLIERAVSVTENSIITKDSISEDQGIPLTPMDASIKEECEISEKFIQGHDLPRSEEKKIEGILNFLENLRIARSYLISSKNSLIDENIKDSVKNLKKGSSFLTSLLQLANGKTSGRNYDIINQLICSELSKMEFLRGFLLIKIGKVNSALEAFDRTALFSTIIHNWRTGLTINYLKALIRIFHGFYTSAIKQYDFTSQLAEVYNERKLILKCTIGKALALFMGTQENKEQAISIIEELSNYDTEKYLEEAMIVFSELGDYFLALGHSQISASLYNESLEMAIDGNFEYKIPTLLDKLKRAYIATILSGYTMEDINVDLLFQKAYKLKNVDKYNEQIRQYHDFHKLYYTKFQFLTGKRVVAYQNLNKKLKDYFEVIKIQPLANEKTLFVALHTELGLLGFLIFGDYELSGVAENYSLKLNTNAKVRIYTPNTELKQEYLIRAIIEIKNKEYIDVIYNLPIFFKQMNI